MITQGYPLFAVDQHGNARAVIGWESAEGGDACPVVVDLHGDADTPEAYAVRTSLLTYTTQDPTAQTFTAELMTEPEDLRQRMAALADRIAGDPAMKDDAPGLIRDELDK